MKEMLGGCCVCSDERGWTENPLVYCDGQGCCVAVHQACYGIVTVPTGPWYCRKCESQERSVRVRCELCPSKDGALKRTDSAGWAHVVCALYIPEVRFGNVTTMEPIILHLIPAERFNKMCYICEENGKGSRATFGACMQCNKTGCKQQFHVTCAQALGLLCEEAGNYLDNVKYCGYCQHHYSKLKKGGNVKTIPPYKPISVDNGSSDSSPEKEAEAPLKISSTTTKRKSSSSKSSTSSSKSKSNASPSCEVNGLNDDKSNSGQNTPKDTNQSSPGTSKFTTSNFVEAVVTQSESIFANDGTPTSSIAATAVNIKSSGTVNVSHKTSAQSKSNVSTKSSHTSKKRKTGARTPTVPSNENSNNSNAESNSSTAIVTPSVVVTPQTLSSNIIQPTVTEATSLSTISEPEKTKKLKVDSSPVQSTSSSSSSSITTSVLTETPTSVISSVTQSQPSTTVITAAAAAATTTTTTTTTTTPTPVVHSPTTTTTTTTSTATSIVVSVPLTATSLTNSVQSVVTSAPTLYQQLQQSMNTSAVNNEVRPNPIMSTNAEQFNTENLPAKRSRSQSTEKQDKTRKAKRGSSSSNSLPLPPIPTTSAASYVSINSNSNSNSNTLTISKRMARSNHQTTPPPPPPPLPPAVSTALVPQSIIQGPVLTAGHFSSITSDSGNNMGPVIKDSPPSSPNSESMSSTGPGRRKRKSAGGGTGSGSITPVPSASTITNVIMNNTKEEKDIKLFQNGVSAPHMLGNQLNPTSTMAQKMSDTLTQELEAHSIFTEASNSSTTLVGPQLHSRVIASVRSNQSAAPPPTSFSSVFSTNSNTNTASNSNTLGGGAIPQTLDQLLERQWEQGSQFLMEQAQHFDIASLLSCLHQLRAENVRLEEHVNNLLQRRDHLLAVNARLAIPLTTQSSPHPVNNIHPSVNSSHSNIGHSDVSSNAPAPISRINRDSRINNSYLPHSSSGGHSAPMENGLPPNPSPPAPAPMPQYSHRGPLAPPQSSPTFRHSPVTGYHQSQPSNIISQTSSSNSTVVRNSSATPEPLRGLPRSVPQPSSSYMSMHPPMSNQPSSIHNLHNAHGLPPPPPPPPTTTTHGIPQNKPS